MVLALDLMFKSPDKEAEVRTRPAVPCVCRVRGRAKLNGNVGRRQILEEVYRAINSMDLSRIPILTEPQKVRSRRVRYCVSCVCASCVSCVSCVCASWVCR
jgi:hypothetical protein